MSELVKLDAAGRQLPWATCPVCGYRADCASPADPALGEEVQPAAGDITLCLKCGELLQYTASMEVIPAEVSALLECQKDRRSWRLLCRAQTLIRAKRFIK